MTRPEKSEAGHRPARAGPRGSAPSPSAREASQPPVTSATRPAAEPRPPAAGRVPGADAAQRPLRRDAERNRRRILEGASQAFAELGLDVTTDEIARRAGVGIGTFYRRFPTKELLIEALFEDRLAKLVELAEECLRAADPWDGLVTFLEQSTARQVADRGLKELVFSTAHGRERIAADRERIGPLFIALVERAQRAGALRADVAGTDVGLLQLMLTSVADFTRDVAPDTWRRYLAIFLDGLRAERTGPSPLGAPPLRPGQIGTIMDAFRRR